VNDIYFAYVKKIHMTKTKKKSDYHHGDLRTSMIKEALGISKSQGARSVTLSAVSKKLKVSVAAPYRHFADKEALLAAAAVSSFERFRETLEEARADKNAEKALVNVGLAFVQFSRSYPECAELMFSMSFEAKAFPALGKAHEAAYQELAHAVSACVASKHVQLVSQQMWFLLQGASSNAGSTHGIDVAAVIKHAVSQVLATSKK
jgi:AcrR family transcriptional regulator